MHLCAYSGPSLCNFTTIVLVLEVGLIPLDIYILPITAFGFYVGLFMVLLEDSDRNMKYWIHVLVTSFAHNGY